MPRCRAGMAPAAPRTPLVYHGFTLLLRRRCRPSGVTNQKLAAQAGAPEFRSSVTMIVRLVGIASALLSAPPRNVENACKVTNWKL